MDVREIRELSKKFTPEQIEGCITQQLETGRNICVINSSTEETINELAKAQFVRDRVDKGISLGDALRELAEKMRQILGTVKGNE
ncbi:MAG: hypothetical protein A2X59_10195 [Nitrospirae bacterium GWC2_42_7]|nr:MAG: hypothetical protein A2X59_10195 [Nitrospirae bacterium GWC2_42_7]